MIDFDEVYYEGYNAYNSGTEDFENPYRLSDEKFFHWYHGWQDAACKDDQ